MGSGLAAQFRRRYPVMHTEYQMACDRGAVQIGRMWTWYHEPEQRWLINFPTKAHWRDPSKMIYIIQGLKDLRLVITNLQLGSLAIPALGCGLGGLKWSDVEPLIVESLKDTSARIDIYPPG